MVENPRGCVLQWAGHAGYVTERFSGLLARQALVDVTLVCEEQKLRVHKLVLASNSIYFERPSLTDILFTACEVQLFRRKEILQQDLGQEPIIFLKDLSFEILKAMVEFMYCGETTISYQLLPSLLTATKTFKVKELTTVIDAMMTSKIENSETSTNIEKYFRATKIFDTTHNDADYIDVKCDEPKTAECFLLCDKHNTDTNPNENQSLENNVIVDTPEHELERTLYEESQNLNNIQRQSDTSISKSAAIKTTDNNAPIVSTRCKIKEVPKRCYENIIVKDNTYSTDDGLKPILYEQCCDFSDIDECDEASMSLSRSCLEQIEKDFAQYTFEDIDVPKKVGKCVKVYTHKRRKSTDEIKNKSVDISNIIQSPPSTDCIDLLDEPSTNDIPVTLLTSLDMESAEYIISLSTENIQSIVGASMSEQHTLRKCKEITPTTDYNKQEEDVTKKELNTESSGNHECIKPILRRSSRLNQQEVEETVNNNNSIKESIVREKHFKKSHSPNTAELCIKGKRKVRDTDRKVPEQIVTNVQPTKRNFGNTRTQKNTSKLIERKNNKATCPVPNKDKYEQKIKTNGRVKCEMSEKMEINNSSPSSAKLSAIEHINRALWGDMSDISENYENKMNLSDYMPDTEIPFAVGLLPLRTALEKMQATPDYQPRKTRSSVAPIKQESNTLKRKSSVTLENAINSKKQSNYVSNSKENANTVCHIQISTAPSQYIRNRKKFLPGDIATLEPPSVMSGQ